MNLRRALAVLGALTGAGALVLQFIILCSAMDADGHSPIDVAWRFVGFFTILTNVLVTAIWVGAALRPAPTGGRNGARAELAAANAIIMVGVVYHLVLANMWAPQGAQLVADIALHTATPLLFGLFWIVGPHGVLKWSDALFCLIWPLSYCVYALARGARDGWYAYPFLDPTTTSWPALLGNIGVLSAAFLAVGMALVAIDKGMARRRLTESR